MPTESAIPQPTPPTQSLNLPSTTAGAIKCSLCGSGGLSSSPQRSNDGIVLLNDPIERICGACVRAQDIRRRMEEAVANVGEDVAIGMGLRGGRLKEDAVDTPARAELGATSEDEVSDGRDKPESTRLPSPIEPQPPSIEAIPSWTPDTRESPSPATDEIHAPVKDVVPNTLLDLLQSRINSNGKGALYPGASFKGTQTSGRSAYEVEVKIADVNLAESTVSGYLSISHLTDAHPQLTTFFTGEIIGPQYGFITGPRFGATEHDDMRHWGRFEQFRRPATRGDMIRPELFLRDPLPDRNKGETRAKDRDYMFLRIKERFLLPDHRVKDISGASFAGFYYAMIDFSPGLRQAHEPEPPLVAPTSPRSPPMSPPLLNRRRSSETGTIRRASMSDHRTSQARLSRSPAVKQSESTEATIRGYYFHSLNQEPFQELFLTHVPNRSLSTFEMR